MHIGHYKRHLIQAHAVDCASVLIPWAVAPIDRLWIGGANVMIYSEQVSSHEYGDGSDGACMKVM